MCDAADQNHTGSAQGKITTRKMPEYHLVAGNLIENEGKYLLVQEGKEHVKGLWNIPAGSIEEREGPKDAAKREVREEAGINVEIEGLTGVFFDDSDYMDATVVVVVFNSKITNQNFELRPQEGEEILETGFYSRKEIEDMDLRTPFILDAIENLEEGKTAEPEAVRDYR